MGDTRSVEKSALPIFRRGFSAAVLLSAAAFAACYSGLVIRKYVVKTLKLEKRIRLVLITDLHGCFYGKNQRRIIEKICRQNPDAVVMAGDVIDERMPVFTVRHLLNGIKGRYPCYYVTGNHEVRTGRMNAVKEMFRRYGVTVLDGACEILKSNGASIAICGADDPEASEGGFRRQLEKALAKRNDGLFTVLLAHRPERLSIYADYGCDLVLSGHAHGGQWRIPYVLNGLYAANQGLFPKYAGGRYEFGATGMVVSRGLARESTPFIPRIFNPPELAVIDIEPPDNR